MAMARTFRRPRRSQPISELNVTNLIDLGFTLLIIFMIATPLINQEQTMPMQLPITSKSPSQKQEKELFQAIAIDKNGRYYWGTSNQPISVNDLRQRLDDLAEKPKPPVIRLRADGTVDDQRVMTLLDEIKSRGLSRVTLDSQTDRCPEDTRPLSVFHPGRTAR